MKMLSKFRGLLVGGALVLTFVLAQAAFVFAAPPAPTAPAPSACADCQAEQDALDVAYLDLEAMVADVAAVSDQVEPLLSAMDPVDAADQLALITSGQQCENSNNLFRYYSSFMFDTEIYCFADAAEYDDFFQSVLVADALNAVDWTTIMNDLSPLITDVEDLLASIDALLVDLEDCELQMCPVPITCADCEAIAADLQVVLDDLTALKDDADVLYTTITDFEADISAASQDIVDLALLEDEFTQMVEGANGMTGADCDNLQLDPGQEWGVVHNFSSVQWCFVDEPNVKMKDFVSDLDDYWMNDSALHLPADATLSQDLDTLMNSYITNLDNYEATLSDLENAAKDVDQFSNSLDNCLADLQTSTDPGMCTVMDEPTMEGLVASADDALGTGYMPQLVSSASTSFDDTPGHWAEVFIQELKDAGIVSGDGGTNNFRPDGPLNRAEAAKITPLAKGDTISLCNPSYFPDVAVLDWFCEYVSTSQEKSYFEGYGDGTFQPANLILRAEAVAVIMRATGFSIPNYSTYTFPDVVGNEWYANYAEKAYQCGIIEGRLVGTEQLLVGADNITRAEFAKIVNLAIYNVLLESDCADYTP